MPEAWAKIGTEGAKRPIVADHPLELRRLWRACSISPRVVEIAHHPDIEVSIDVPWIEPPFSCFFHAVSLVYPILLLGFRARYSRRWVAIGVADCEGEFQPGVSGDAGEGRRGFACILVVPAIVAIEHT